MGEEGLSTRGMTSTRGRDQQVGVCQATGGVIESLKIGVLLNAYDQRARRTQSGISIQTAITIDVELFPQSREELAKEVSKAYDIKNSKRHEASVILNNLHGFLIKRMVEKYGRPPVADSVEATADNKNTPEAATKHSSGVGQWFHKVVALEGQSTHVLMKAIIQKLNCTLSELALHQMGQYSEGESTKGLAIVYDDAIAKVIDKDGEGDSLSNDKKVGKGKIEIQRFPMTGISQSPKVEIPYTGKVIEEKAAVTMNKTSCLPLGDNGGKGPKLYLEGVSTANILRSDGCIAWNIPPLPLLPKDSDTATAGAGEPATDVTTTAVVKELTPTPAEDAAQAAKVKKTNALKLKKSDPIATHMISWKKIQFEVASQEYEYSLPVLVDNPDNAQVYNVRCFRKNVPWDFEPIKRKNEASPKFVGPSAKAQRRSIIAHGAQPSYCAEKGYNHGARRPIIAHGARPGHHQISWRPLPNHSRQDGVM